jgi:hypothetical protein
MSALARKMKRKDFTIRSILILRLFQRIVLKVIRSLLYLKYSRGSGQKSPTKRQEPRQEPK